jgi:hypothetical protein
MRDSTLPKTTAGERGRVPELSRRRRFPVLAICCASIVVVMDISIVNVARWTGARSRNHDPLAH